MDATRTTHTTLARHHVFHPMPRVDWFRVKEQLIEKKQCLLDAYDALSTVIRRWEAVESAFSNFHRHLARFDKFPELRSRLIYEHVQTCDSLIVVVTSAHLELERFVAAHLTFPAPIPLANAWQTHNAPPGIIEDVVSELEKIELFLAERRASWARLHSAFDREALAAFLDFERP